MKSRIIGLNGEEVNVTKDVRQQADEITNREKSYSNNTESGQAYYDGQ